MDNHPLVVDLDGSIVKTDMLCESALTALHNNPLLAFKMIWWLLKGKAVLKHNLARLHTINPATLPYNSKVIKWLKQQYASGRKLILCTATNYAIAQTIADYLGIFNEVIASTDKINLIGQAKARILRKRFGRKGFDYLGNSTPDLKVWQQARYGILVNTSQKITHHAAAVCKIINNFSSDKISFSIWQKVLRTHHWLKNILIFIPLLANRQLNNVGSWWELILSFTAFSLCASSVYITNDLLDLDSDRLHPRKCLRPFASGDVPIAIGIILVPSLLIASIMVSQAIGRDFCYCLLCYFVLTLAYSLILKRIMLVDCFVLVILYNMRIIAGSIAIHQELSFWLISIPTFIFLSLACIKRYTELTTHTKNGSQKIHGRGYLTSDAPLIQTIGIVSGYTGMLVLALYLNTTANLALYHYPQLIWATLPVSVFWLSWIWVKAHRGQMHDDPVIFALRDRTSILSGIVFLLLIVFGTIGIG